MRWNFVARTADEIRIARDDWQQHRVLGDIAAYLGAWLDAPRLKGRPIMSKYLRRVHGQPILSTSVSAHALTVRNGTTAVLVAPLHMASLAVGRLPTVPTPAGGPIHCDDAVG